MVSLSLETKNSAIGFMTEYNIVYERVNKKLFSLSVQSLSQLAF